MCIQTLSLFRHLKMRNQIIIIQGTILIFLLSVAASTTYIQIAILNLLQNRTLAITLEKIEQRQISLTSSFISEQITRKYQRSIFLLESIAQFENSYAQYSDKITVFNSLEKYVFNRYNTQIPQFFYNEDYGSSNLSKQLNKSNITLLNSSFLLFNQYSLLLNSPTPEYLEIVDVSFAQVQYIFSNQISASNQELTELLNQNHLNQSKQYPNSLYFFSPVIQNGDAANQFFITFSIFNRQKQLIGIAKLFQSTIYETNFQNFRHNILLVNGQGQLLYNSLQPSYQTRIVYIYDENITGFNNSDWISIQQNAAQRSGINRSQESTHLQLYNKRYQQNVFVGSKTIVYGNLTLVIFPIVSSIDTLDFQMQKIKDLKHQWQMKSNAIILATGSISLLISLIFIHYICQPLVDIVRQITKHILSIGNNINYEIFKIITRYKSRKNLFTILINTIQKIWYSNPNKKCEMCKLTEQMKYPSMEGKVQIISTVHNFLTSKEKIGIDEYYDSGQYSQQQVLDLIRRCITSSREIS